MEFLKIKQAEIFLKKYKKLLENYLTTDKIYDIIKPDKGNTQTTQKQKHNKRRIYHENSHNY